KRHLILLAVMSMLLPGCGEQVSGGTLVYGLTLAPSGIDPHIDASSELGIPLTSVYDPLVWLTPEGEFVPGLAKDWEISQEGLTYTFYLRDDVVFHDGTPFNADAVRFSLQRIVDPDTQSRKARGMLGPYDRTEVVDDHTVRVHFREPYAPFLTSLSTVYLAMVSPEAVSEWGDEYQFHQIGTGPFMFKEYVPKDHLTLVRNPDYDWAPSFFERQGLARLEEVTFRFYTDPAVRVLALESGEADVMGEIPPQDAIRLDEDPDYVLLPVPIPGQPLQFFLNTRRSPLDDDSVRRALIYAVDRRAIVETVFEAYSLLAFGPLTRPTFAYDSTVEGMYPYDPRQAAGLLDEAGWIDSDGDGVRDRDGQPLSLDAILMSWGYVPEVAQILQDQLMQVGVDIESRQMTFSNALGEVAEGSYHLAPFLFSSSDPDILRTTFHSSNIEGGFNWSKVSDAQLDAWLDEGKQEMDEAARREIYARIQQHIMEEAMILPIRDYVNLNAARADVRNLRYDRQGWFPWLYDVYVAEE
ncbi:MAG: ABC transporter substrate-binding protein, partial [Anaerolineae bacterium]